MENSSADKPRITTVKALSIKQPWAGLIVLGYKSIEVRSKVTGHRGELLIHASTSYDEEGARRLRDMPFLAEILDDPLCHERGFALGLAVLDRCTEWAPSYERASLCNPGDGFYAWHLKCPLKFQITHRFSVRGQLGIYSVKVRDRFVENLIINRAFMDVQNTVKN